MTPSGRGTPHYLEDHFDLFIPSALTWAAHRFEKYCVVYNFFDFCVNKDVRDRLLLTTQHKLLYTEYTNQYVV